MRLYCTEIADVVGLVPISVESGFSVERVRKFFVKKGLKPINSGVRGHGMVYDSRLVREAFRDVKG